jgi:hypothetical protein
MADIITNDRIKRLEDELRQEKQAEMIRVSAELWGRVRDLDHDKLKLLHTLIHIELYGDGEDD